MSTFKNPFFLSHLLSLHTTVLPLHSPSHFWESDFFSHCPRLSISSYSSPVAHTLPSILHPERQRNQLSVMEISKGRGRRRKWRNQGCMHAGKVWEHLSVNDPIHVPCARLCLYFSLLDSWAQRQQHSSDFSSSFLLGHSGRRHFPASRILEGGTWLVLTREMWTQVGCHLRAEASTSGCPFSVFFYQLAGCRRLRSSLPSPRAMALN